MADETGTPKKGDYNAKSSINFTDGESKLFLSIMSHLTSDIQFDAEAVAAELGYKDGSIVKTRWGQIKRKKLADGAAGGGIQKRTPKKSSPKKAKAVEGGGGDIDDDEDGNGLETPKQTPKKRGRKPSAKKAAEDEQEGVKKEESGDEGDD